MGKGEEPMGGGERHPWVELGGTHGWVWVAPVSGGAPVGGGGANVGGDGRNLWEGLGGTCGWRGAPVGGGGMHPWVGMEGSPVGGGSTCRWGWEAPMWWRGTRG